MASIRRARPESTSTTHSLMQEVPGAFPTTAWAEESEHVDPPSLSQALYARRAEYVRPKHVRIKVGTWNVAGYKGTERDLAGWFIQGKGVSESLAGLAVHDQAESSVEDVNSQEARYERKQTSLPAGDPGSLPGNEDVGLYVLGLQEMIDINSVSEAVRPYTDPAVANKWKQSISEALPNGYRLVAEQQLIGLLLLIYASPDVAKEVRSVSTTSVGTGLMGYMGNKGAVTARLVLGDTTRLVFVNCHLAAGADKSALERRNWDAAQIISRTRFEPIQDSMDLQQTTGEQIGDEDFAFWMGDLNYRLEGIPGDDVRRLLMLHTRNEYDLSQTSSQKIENELKTATESAKNYTSDRNSLGSSVSASPRNSTDFAGSNKTSMTSIIDEVSASEDPASLLTTISSLLPHDELHQQMKTRKAFHDGWQEGDVSFLPTYKYDVGSVGVFDSSEKKRAPSWCDRILYRTRRDKLAYEAKVKEEQDAKRKDEEMKANGTDMAASDEEILYDYDPEADGDDTYDDYDEFNDAEDGVVITKEGFEDEIHLEHYMAHQQVLSSDHKPLDAIFMLKYDAVVPELKARVHAEVAKELDRVENEGRPTVTVVVDKHREEDVEVADNDPNSFEGLWFGSVRWGQAKHRSITVANTGRVPASFTFIERPIGSHQIAGVAPSWINMKMDEHAVSSSSKGTEPFTLEPGDTCLVELELRIFDLTTAKELNEGLRALEDILVLRVDGGRDHFVPLRATWQATSLGHSIDKLCRIPEGGIRKLQNQKLTHGTKGTPSAGRTGSGQSAMASSASTDDQPVRFSAPRELFKLTEAVEDVSSRVVAEWDMINPSDTSDTPSTKPIPPWLEVPGWPFDEACWTEKETAQFHDAQSEVVDAIDSDSSIEERLPSELPRIQQLYVLASVLLLFLQSISDGVVPPELWAQLDAYLSDHDKTKRRPSIDDEKMAIQEIMSRQPGHSISFILVTSMLDRMLQDLSNSVENAGRSSMDEQNQSPLSPVKKAGGTLRRMATLGKLPPESTASVIEQTRTRYIRLFADAMVKTGIDGQEKTKSIVDKRKRDLVGIFIGRRD